jgi:uncharacterized protein with PQ loop repeat
MSALADVGLACGYLGALLGVCMLAPQVTRTFRNRGAPGVSALSWALTALGSGAWLLYGLRANEAPQLPGNTLVVAGAAVIVLAVPSSVAQRGRLGMLTLAGLALLASALVLPTREVGYVALAVGIVSTVPQTFRSLVGSSAGEVSAVSVPSWLLRATSQVCWLVFAIANHDVAIFASAVFILSSSVLLSVVELRNRPASRPSDRHCASPVV